MKLLKWLGLTLTAALAVWVVLIGIGRLQYRDGVDDAIAVLEEGAAPTGRSGYFALFFAASPLEGKAANDAWPALASLPFDASDVHVANQNALLGVDRATPLLGEFCQSAAPCLEEICETCGDQRRGLEAARGIFLRTSEALATDHAHFPLDRPIPSNVTFPAYHWITLLPKMRANDFLRRDRAEATDGLCRDLAGMRRWSMQPGNLVEAMTLDTGFARGSRLLIEMLETQPTMALPPSCTGLLEKAPAPSASFCRMLKGEWRYTQSFARDFELRRYNTPWLTPEPRMPSVLRPLLGDADVGKRASVLTLAQGCGGEVASSLDRGEVPPLKWPTMMSAWDWVVRPLNARSETAMHKRFSGFDLDIAASRWIEHHQRMDRLADALRARRVAGN